MKTCYNAAMSFINTLLKIAFPMILQNFLSSFVNMLDTIMVGQLGAVDIAAVGLGNQVFWIVNIMIFGTVSGGSIFISQYWGKKDIEAIHKTTGIMLAVSTIIALLFTFAGMFIPEVCLSLYTKDKAVIEKGSEYLRIVSPSYLFFGLSFAFATSEKSTERVKLPAVATIISVILNAILNFLFIFGVKISGIQIIPAMGIVGAAIATVISRIVEAIIVFSFAYIKKYEVAVNPKHYFKFDKTFLAKYVKICLPVLINETLWGSGISMQSSIFAHSGTFVIAAFNIMTTVSNLLYPICLGCGNATSIIVGKTIGEQKYDEAKSLAKKLCLFIALLALTLGILLVPLIKIVPFVFKVEEEVIYMASILLLLRAAIYCFDAFNMVSVVGVFRSGGDTVFALLMDVGFMYTIALPLGWLAVLVWHLPFWAVYLCILTEPILKSVAGLIRLLSDKWLKDLTIN